MSGSLILLRSHVKDLRGDVEKVHARVNKVEQRQDLLRGEGDFARGQSLFMRRIECDEHVKHCQSHICGEMEKIRDQVAVNIGKVNAIENFARWYLSAEKGLPLPQVNKIMGGARRFDD